MTPQFLTVVAYDAEHEWARSHLVPNDSLLRTKCGLLVAALDTSTHAHVPLIKCPHCPNAAPRFGDGFTMIAGVHTAQFTYQFLEAHSNDRFANTREYAAMLGLDSNSFDTALPMDWYDDVQRLTGVWPQYHGFVWSYEVARISGEPVPVTLSAYLVLGWYEAARKLERALS